MEQNITLTQNDLVAMVHDCPGNGGKVVRFYYADYEMETGVLRLHKCMVSIPPQVDPVYTLANVILRYHEGRFIPMMDKIPGYYTGVFGVQNIMSGLLFLQDRIARDRWNRGVANTLSYIVRAVAYMAAPDCQDENTVPVGAMDQKCYLIPIAEYNRIEPLF